MRVQIRDMTDDILNIPIIFLRIGWMHRYQGQTSADRIAGGGAFVKEHGYGHEIFNFQVFEGRVYGYVQPPKSGYNEQTGPGFNIDRLGASSTDDRISGVLAIWVATAPHGGSFIVGWYRNATIYRYWQRPPTGSGRRHGENELGYFVTAASEDATLLPPDERVFRLPRGSGGMGQANVWYADSEEQHRQLRAGVLRYVETGSPPLAPSSPDHSGVPRQVDPLRRQEVERVAVLRTTEYFTGLGYVVDSVEGDNVGWDLEAVHPSRPSVLRLEVKGLSGRDVQVDLTPNEYANMCHYRDAYRLCDQRPRTARTLDLRVLRRISAVGGPRWAGPADRRNNCCKMLDESSRLRGWALTNILMIGPPGPGQRVDRVAVPFRRAAACELS
jgi:hypothetical protein